MKKCKHKNGYKQQVSAGEVEDICIDCGKVLAVRTRVLSSNIFAVGREGDETTVQFMHAGAPDETIYRVKGMSKTDHEKLMTASSIGSFYATNIRSNKKYKIEKE